MSNLRIGHGYDIHRLVYGRKLFLGGVLIPFEKGLDGHSDADVVLHAVCDALLGAAGLRDIGYYFPPTDQTFKNISSLLLLQKVKSLLDQQGFLISNIDISIVAEEPKLKPYIEQMKEAISKTINLESGRLGIKVTTNEGVDEIGRAEAICAHCVCLIESAIAQAKSA